MVFTAREQVVDSVDMPLLSKLIVSFHSLHFASTWKVQALVLGEVASCVSML
jgi:hypothetical protein